MGKFLVAIVITLVAGLAVGAWVSSDDEERGFVSASSELSSNDVARLSERLAILEEQVAYEQAARQQLEEQLRGLSISESDALVTTAAGATRADGQPGERPARENRRRNYADMMARYEQRRRDNLISNGYSDDEANRLLELESSAQYDALLARYEASQSGETVDSGRSNAQSIVRATLGDDEYERYLAAQNQPTAVKVLSMLKGSPGSDAGLLPGDDIVRYDGQRTFNMNELRQLAFSSNAGDVVVVEINRDGVPMQLTLPAGPIGMNGSGASVRVRGFDWGG